MTVLNFNNFVFEYDEKKIVAIADKKRIAFLPLEYDDIHLIVELKNEKLVFQPRWSVVITQVENNRFLIESN